MRRGDLELAAESYKAALRLAPHLTACWCNLGNIHLKTGNPEDAIALYLQALTLKPGALAVAHQSGAGADGHAAISAGQGCF